MAGVTDPQAILQMHKQYADEFSMLAQSGLQAAFAELSQSGIFNYDPAHIIITFPDFGRPNDVGALPVLPVAPTLPTLGDLTPYVDIPIPTFPVAPESHLSAIPALAYVSKPSSGAPDLNAVAPNIPSALVLPTAPSYLALPSLVLPYTSLSIPTAPVVTVPGFEGIRPDNLQPFDPNALVTKYTTERDDHRNLLPAFARETARGMLATFAPEYDDIRQKINGIIAKYMDPVTGGGTSVPENVERAILSRAAQRSMTEVSAALNDAADKAGKAGHFTPAALMSAIYKKTAIALGDSMVVANTDIATKNLELEQANFQMMLKLGEQFDEKILDVASQYMQLALQMDSNAIASAKEIVTTYLGAYNLQVMVYKAMWDGYTADAEVLKARISAMDSVVRLYESEIRAELAKTEINKATVDIISAVAGVNRSLADTYRAQVDAVTATLEVSRIQMGIFEARVRAYAAQVSAYEARWQAYTAEVNGNVAQLAGYRTQAEAYTAQVGAYTATVNGLAAQMKALADTNSAIGQRNDATVKVFSTTADVAIKNFEGLVAGYSAESSAIVQQANIEVEYWRASANLIFQEYNAALNQTFEYAREQMNLFRGQMEAAINAANGLSQMANVAGNLASGAMTGLTSFAGTLVNSEQ